MPLSVRVFPPATDQPELARVGLDGSLDSSTADALQKALAPVLDGPVKTVVFDLSNLGFLSSAGIRVIVSTRKRLSDRGGVLLMTNLQPQILKVFEIITALPTMRVFNDIRELDQDLGAMQRESGKGDAGT